MFPVDLNAKLINHVFFFKELLISVLIPPFKTACKVKPTTL